MIRSIEPSQHGVVVDLDGRRLDLGWTWLRDHARDESSFLHSAQQRLVTADVVAAAGPAEVSLEGDTTLVVEWSDGPTCRFDADWLRGLGEPADAATLPGGFEPDPWTAAPIADRHRPIAFHEILTDDGLARAVRDLWRDGLVTVTDVPLDVASTRQVVERFGYVRNTIFGSLWEYGSDGAYDDTASTGLEITPHTDGTYSHDAPGLLALHCHLYDAEGAENVFVDGWTLADRLSPEAHEVLSTVEIPGQYIGDGAHLMARRPVLRHHDGRLVQVSYNHHDRAPFLLPEPEMSRVYAALHEFDRLTTDPDLCFEVALRAGDMVLFDNWRLLHGRRSFRGDRRMAGGYVNREDVESTTRRVVADQASRMTTVAD